MIAYEIMHVIVWFRNKTWHTITFTVGDKTGRSCVYIDSCCISLFGEGHLIWQSPKMSISCNMIQKWSHATTYRLQKVISSRNLHYRLPIQKVICNNWQAAYRNVSCNNLDRLQKVISCNNLQAAERSHATTCRQWSRAKLRAVILLYNNLQAIISCNSFLFSSSDFGHFQTPDSFTAHQGVSLGQWFHDSTS